MTEFLGFASTDIERDGETVLSIRGDIDMATAPVLLDAIKAAAATNDDVIVVDLAGSTFIDSSGLGALISASQLLGLERFAVRSPRPQARKLFELSGVSGVIAVVG